jgi:hypothetical protein
MLSVSAKNKFKLSIYKIFEDEVKDALIFFGRNVAF